MRSNQLSYPAIIFFVKRVQRYYFSSKQENLAQRKSFLLTLFRTLRKKYPLFLPMILILFVSLHPKGSKTLFSNIIIN